VKVSSSCSPFSAPCVFLFFSSVFLRKRKRIIPLFPKMSLGGPSLSKAFPPGGSHIVSHQVFFTPKSGIWFPTPRIARHLGFFASLFSIACSLVAPFKLLRRQQPLVTSETVPTTGFSPIFLSCLDFPPLIILPRQRSAPLSMIGDIAIAALVWIFLVGTP